MSTENILQGSRATLVPSSAALSEGSETSQQPSDLIQRLQSLNLQEETLQEPDEAQLISEDTPEVQQEATQTQQVEEAPKLDDDFDPVELDKFSRIFEKMFGVKVDEFKQTQQQVVQQQREVALRNDLNTLQTEWGVDEAEVAKRIDLVSQKLQTLPEQQRQALDNLEGIRLLWSAIGANPTTPRFEKTNKKGAPSNGRPLFTQREIDSMPQQEYAQNAQAILYAYKNGLVQR